MNGQETRHVALDADMDTSDEVLLLNFANGDATAARLLTARLTPRALGYAARVLGDRAEAEDVTQEAMLRLWKIAPDWRQGEAQVSTWLYRVTANLCTDRLRKRRTVDIDAVAEPMDDSASAEDQMQSAARAVALEEADQTDMVTVWLAVTDATVENGCLQVVPHETDLLPHCPKRQTAIADGFIDTSKAKPLPVKAGGAVLFHPMTPHASLPNVSDGFRWSFDLRFNKTGQPTGRAHFPEFVARSRSAPETELRDWRAWKSMWEAARARLAVDAHIDIHRWSADAPVCA